MDTFVWINPDALKDPSGKHVKLLTDLCRLRYSEMNKTYCVIDTGNEGNSDGQTSIDHQFDTEVINMDFVFKQFELFCEEGVADKKAYHDVLTALVKALYGYQLLFNLKPFYDYKFDWPPVCSIGQTVESEEVVTSNLKIAVEAGYAYLKQNNYKKIHGKLVGQYDWISIEPLI